MKKKNWYKLFTSISVLLIMGFFISVGKAYFIYPRTGGAMPFSALLLINCVEFLLPAVAAYVVARICKAKYN